MTRKAKQEDFIRTALRLPRDLHARIQDDAEKNGRTMNAEIISRLAESYHEMGLQEIAKQNIKTQDMIKIIIDAISVRR